MSMKRFISRRKRDDDKENIDDDQHSSDMMMPVKSNHSSESHDSIRDLRPMFGKQQEIFDMNLNPSISITNQKALTIGSSIKDYSLNSSLFSGRQSYSTNQSSLGSAKNRKQYEDGQQLQVLNVVEELDTEKESSIEDRLKVLHQNLSYINSQLNNSLISLSTSVINSIDCLKQFIIDTRGIRNNKSMTTYNNEELRKIMKVYLHFHDNLLRDEVYIKLKLLLVKNFNDFIATVNFKFTIDSETIIKPGNFAIGINKNNHLPSEKKLMKIMDKMASDMTSFPIKEQNGSFVAPILRGLTPELNILCLYFGYPQPNEYHKKLAQNLLDMYDDVHIMVIKNKIEMGSLNDSSTTQKFKLPFRIPSNIDRPPMSISISTEDSHKISGTMGGYIYPKINLKNQPNLKSYANSKFAISCGHVCLDTADPSNYPHISAPSSALISLYKNALSQQYQNTNSNDIESKQAYAGALEDLQELFPLKKTKSSKNSEIRNLPRVRFGQIIWGERTLINLSFKNEISGLQEKKLSDLAIIKVNKQLKCDENYLGDDIPFNEYDPSLIYDNLYVRKVLNLKRYAPTTIDENINEVDSDISNASADSNTYFGVPVFKYGSTTKYTVGYLNGIKLVYWLDGAIHSSEFIVNSLENNTCFASGGDSGSWVLTKLQDMSQGKGLGVMGMLHSYDGEYKQFGLFTPMNEILTRLQEVTNIEWGVVGCSDDKMNDDEINDETIDNEVD